MAKCEMFSLLDPDLCIWNFHRSAGNLIKCNVTITAFSLDISMVVSADIFVNILFLISKAHTHIYKYIYIS